MKFFNHLKQKIFTPSLYLKNAIFVDQWSKKSQILELKFYEKSNTKRNFLSMLRLFEKTKNEIFRSVIEKMSLCNNCNFFRSLIEKSCFFRKFSTRKTSSYPRVSVLFSKNFEKFAPFPDEFSMIARKFFRKIFNFSKFPRRSGVFWAIFRRLIWYTVSSLMRL